MPSLGPDYSVAVDVIMVHDLISFALCFHLPKILNGLLKVKPPDYLRLHFEWLHLVPRWISSIRLGEQHKCYRGY